MKLLALIATFFFSRMKGPQRGLRETVMDLFEDMVLKGRKPIILVLAGVSAVIFFCGGLFISVLEGTTQYDRVGYVTLTSTLGAGIAMFLIAALGFVYVFAFAWPGASKRDRERDQARAQHEVSSLEHALATLVMDFVKERELRRGRETQGTGPFPPKSKRERERDQEREREQSRSTSAPIH